MKMGKKVKSDCSFGFELVADATGSPELWKESYNLLSLMEPFSVWSRPYWCYDESRAL